MSLALTHSRHRLARRRLSWAQRNRSFLTITAMCLVGLLSLLAIGLTLASTIGIIWFGRFAGALPPPDELTARVVFQTTPVYAADGSTKLYEITDPQGGRRTVISLDQVPRSVIEATIATEDPSFFSNPGFEIRSIVRATYEDLVNHQILSGASTITQQVVRNVLLSPVERQDVSARRKVREIILAYQLTHTYSKEDILQVYLNEINYGNRNYGIEAAAEGYFGRPAAELDLAESALLAGLPQAPGLYDPYTRLGDVKDRQNYVLQRMVLQGYITPDQATAAAAEPLQFADPHALIAPHFVTYVADQLSQTVGDDELYHGGDKVTTTLDPKLQQLAENAVNANQSALQAAGANNVAIVALDPRDGRILAMVGSAGYDDNAISGEVNMALAPLDSAGTLSPLTYALALQSGQTVISRLDDAPLQPTGNGGASLVAPDGRPYLGPVPLRQALGLGLDAPATRVMQLVGNQNFVNRGSRLGLPDFSRQLQYGANDTIAGARVSPLEVAQAYGVLANAGVARQPYAIASVVQPSGKVVAGGPTAPVAVLDPGVAYLISSILVDPSVQPDDAKKLLDVGQPVASRLAISGDQRASWAVGYVPNLVVAVWAGNARGVPLRSDDATGRVWSDFVRAALKLAPAAEYARPSDVVTVSLCKNPGCTQKTDELALKGTEKLLIDANAQTIAKPAPAPTASRSQTPLVNRQPLPSGSAIAPLAAAASATGLSDVNSILVPDLTGLTPTEARTLLSVYGLTSTPLVQSLPVAQLPRGARTVRPGQVAATSPPANQSVAPGTSILLIVRKS